jgi:hypothetical protein
VLKEIETKIWEALFNIATLKVANTKDMIMSLSETLKGLLKKPGSALHHTWLGWTGERDVLSCVTSKYTAC